MVDLIGTSRRYRNIISLVPVSLLPKTGLLDDIGGSLIDTIGPLADMGDPLADIGDPLSDTFRIPVSFEASESK